MSVEQHVANNASHAENHAISSTLPQSMPAGIGSRRLRACMGCKESKLRCKRNEDVPGQSCDRCVSAGRQCVVQGPMRKKRSKKNTSTVASLESKVDALVAALKQRQAGDVEENMDESPPDVSESHIQNTYRIPTNNGRYENNDADRTASSGPFSAAANLDHMIKGKALQEEYQYSFSFWLPRPEPVHEDPIDKGLISWEEAEECFVRFTEEMLPHFPVVVFPSDVKASHVRRARPVLFLAILGAASGFLGEGVRKALVGEFMRVLADRVTISGNKTLDLVQAIQVSAVFYFPPENFDDLKVYQLIHMAAIMAIELDFWQAARPSTSKLSLPKSGELGCPSLTPPGLRNQKTDCQRALLSCYVLCGIAFMITRRPSLMRWTPYMEECVEALENPNTAVKSDLFLCQWVRSQHIAEEVGQHFFMDDWSGNVDTSDMGVQYILRGYEQQFDRWKAQIPPDIQKSTLRCQASIVNLYMHEIFLHVGNSDLRPPTEQTQIHAPEVKPRALTAVHRRALAICIVSVRDVLDIFLAFDTNTLCSIPVFHFVRTAYAVFTMMKIYFAANRPGGNLYGLMEDDDLNVEFYLDEFLRTLQGLLQTRKLRVAAIFRLVLLLLRTWYHRQKAQPDQNRQHVHRDDTIFRTVLETANAVNADGNYPPSSSSPHNANSGLGDATTTYSNISTQGMAGNYLSPSVDTWQLGPEEQMPPWGDFDFAAFLENDNPTLLQIALERLGGLIG